MPNIRQYDSTAGINPSDRGINAADSAAQASAIAGRSIQSSYAQLGHEIGSTIDYAGGQFQEHMARQEITKGMADITALQDNLTKSWNDAANNADPNDHGVRDRFLELQDTSLNDFPSQFQTKAGQEWAQQQVGHLRQHMFEMTAADQSTREGAAIVKNFDVMKNRGSSLLADDPTRFDTLAGMLDSSVSALVKASPSLDPSVAAKLQSETAQQIKEGWAADAVVSAIDKNPQAGRDMLASGKFADYIDGDKHKALSTYADATERAAREQQRADSAEARRAAKERFDALSSAITASVIRPDGSISIPPDFNQNVMKAALLPEAEPGRIEAMLNFQRAVTDDLEKGKPSVTDPNTYSDFQHRMMLDPKDPKFLSQSDVYRARAAHMLSDKDTTMFSSGIEKMSKDPEEKAAAKDFNAFLTGYKGYITKSSYLHVDAYGDQRFYEFQSEAKQYHDYALAKGATEEAIRKDIIKALPRYQYDQKQALRATSEMAGSPLKPLPPVSPAATVQSPSSSVAAPAVVPASRMDELRRIAHGG